MADPIARLNAALQDRYALEREIGAGGMATVYLADDLRHERKVALKVLRPDLAATLGPERFLREIKIAAGLTHPHILPLHDSGEADGFLFYVLPYIDGESLRDRLVREGELPVSEVVRILRDIVDALAHAHDHGLVHRDIKPDNVMLSGRHALVTDFGVAKAVSEATGRHQLTTIGVALGTPAYMSPEQAEASEHIDHRADIYAVGAMAYELLAGASPFAGRSPQMTLLAHVAQVPEPVTTHRQSVPPALAYLVMRCLEKKPADRWQSAEEMLGHLEALATPSGGITPTGTVPVGVAGGAPRFFTPMRIAAAAALVAAVVSGTALLRSDGGEEAASDSDGSELDPNVVAIVPFRFSGPEEVNYLGEGVVDLLAARLTGDVGPRAVDPAASSVVWQELSTDDPAGSGEGLARRFGAGMLLTGSIVADPSGLTLSATLVDVRGATELASASARGVADSLTAVVDRLAAALLSLSTGEYAESLDQLTSTSSEALREYLLGQREYKRGRFAVAASFFQRAVRSDSTFALAAMAWWTAAANAIA
jgi:serine/threonine-protein kinase